MSRLAGLLGLLFCLLVAPAVQAQPAPKFPELTGRVVDDAHVLSAETQAQLTQKLADLEQKTSRQLVVVTLPSLQGYEISDYGYQLLRHWGIGQKGLNNGVVFIIVPSEHKVRIEVGYGMEPIITDALSSVILQERVIPRFRAGDVQGGIVAGTDALIDQMSADPSTAEQRVAAAEAGRTHVHHRSALGGVIPLILLFFIVSAMFRRGRGGGGMGWILPMMFLGSARGWGDRGDGWGGGGGGWGGGGFSGGGGSGGGGGASGSW
ncbi:MAG: TPM domain-containing protein [Caulobacteraceae bacterium]|nr:TPM domain-containing protein [Caulobacteraceae bacterium]